MDLEARTALFEVYDLFVTFGVRWLAEHPDAASVLASELRALADAGPLLVRTGRPPLDPNGSWRKLVEHAERYKAAFPELKYSTIAHRYGIAERTLRKYRALLRRQCTLPAPAFATWEAHCQAEQDAEAEG
jgi:hypothetical protein